MDIVEFFEQSTGKWFSQRTNHFSTSAQPECGKSDLFIEKLAQDDSALVQLCQDHGVDPSSVLYGMRTTWNGTVGRMDETKQAGSTVLALIANPDNPQEGKLLRQTGAGSEPGVGRYVMGNDHTLTLILETETIYSEERLWFASPNLRLRTSVLKQTNGVQSASFCSEIRMGGVKPQPSAASTASQA